MSLLDYIVLVGYFIGMAGIGFWAMGRVKGQEDFLLGGRRFGKWLQAFAAFGAGTGSADPVNTARTSIISGMSGMWSVMSWLFVTPFYWFTGVWYRRMRHLTLGDWFVERYESRNIGAAYTVFGIVFYMVYTSMLFSAIGKVAAPLMGDSVVIGNSSIGLEYILVPAIAVFVIVYGVLGGLTAAYWTDLVQGILIIVLSVMIIPFGLSELVQKFGNPETDGLLSGFRIMHEQLPASMFEIVGSTNAGEFPIHRILAVTLISLVGVMVMPHFIATGGGSAKSESSARIGLVAGNLAKRFCTIGWALTALIVLALYADNAELVQDPDKAWGIAARELLLPGLRGLMLACMLAALMSSADTYMLVCSGLVVRNIYAAFIDKDASEATCLRLARLTGVLVIVGAVVFSWLMMDVFRQLELTWIVPMVFAAPFWVGMFWRRATTTAAWGTIVYSTLFFFLIPWMAPSLWPELRTQARFTQTNQIVTTITERTAVPSDVRRRSVLIEEWNQKNTEAMALSDLELQQQALALLGEVPKQILAGEKMHDTFKSGGTSIFWSGGVKPVGDTALKEVSRVQAENRETIIEVYAGPMKGEGNFRLDFLFYELVGMDLISRNNASLKTLELPPKIFTPFLVMIFLSLITRRNSSHQLDRFYVKMKTPVDPDPDVDLKEIGKSYANPDRYNSRRLFAHPDLEFVKLKPYDIAGFVLTLAACFGVIGLAFLIAGIGG